MDARTLAELNHRRRHLTWSIPLAELLANFAPGSRPQPWTWDDEETELLADVCACCGQPGHYQLRLEAYLAEHGLDQGVCLGTDGRVWDGHHRIVAARRLGIDAIPLESAADAWERFLRDHPQPAGTENATGIAL